MNPPRVLVFLGAYQGAPFLPAQIHSIQQQTIACDLIVSDDGSTDGSVGCVQDCMDASPSVTLIDGPRQGFCANFLSAFDLADVDRYDFVAWSDQDDLWHSDHLARAIGSLQSYQQPAAFGSRTRLVDVSGRAIGYSPLWRRPMTFQNALVQSVVGGNTLVMNRDCVRWIQQCMAACDGAAGTWISHDWAVYLMLSLGSFPLVWDPKPTVSYRQHASNLIGSNRGLSARLDRVARLRNGMFAQWLASHMGLLQQLTEAMSPAHEEVFRHFAEAVSCGGWSSVRALRRSGVYRQGVLDQTALHSAAYLGWLAAQQDQTGLV